MTPRQLELARHALGLSNPDAKGVSYRNYFKAPPYSVDWPDWVAMCDKGYARRRCWHRPDRLYFILTKKGAMAALRDGERLCPEDWPDMAQAEAEAA